ncbi:MAG: hypothetical protein JXA66_05980, partial [Oligoflexia bacterium]|nr:hypothetical protein [Oligoflexia bacterium]
RSKKIILNKNVGKINLNTGPMAISGSTRMQASTIIMAVIGYALLHDKKDINGETDKLTDCYKKSGPVFLNRFIKREADLYKNNKYIIYLTKNYPMTILTDTTERSPTFNLHPFENKFDSPVKPSLSYICVTNSRNSKSAWKAILKRNPRPLEWEGLRNIADTGYLYGFDFSRRALNIRKKYIRETDLHYFSINGKRGCINFSLDDTRHKLDMGKTGLLTENLVLKMLLNIHSTLVMGLMGRYSGNIMTWVRPTNYKLIDRSVRYIIYILSQKGLENISYRYVTENLFEELDRYTEYESIINKVVKNILGKI